MIQQNELKLCLILGNTAYFTTQELCEQWGDDWNDAPYEHNAGIPYTGEGWEIVSLLFETRMEAPHEYARECSVLEINERKYPWLNDGEGMKIYAGENIKEFVNKIIATSGEVFIPVSWLIKTHKELYDTTK